MTILGVLATTNAALLLALLVMARAYRTCITAERRRAGVWEQFLLAAPEPLLITSASGHIRLANRAAAQLFGYSSADLIGQTLATLLAPANEHEDVQPLEQLLLAPAPHCAASNGRARCRDGSQFPALWRSRGIATEDGEQWVLVAVRDLTSDVSGRLQSIDGSKVGYALIALGGGRVKTTDHIDVSVGFEFLKRLGDEVRSGEPILKIYAQDKGKDEAVALLKQAIVVGDGEAEVQPLVLERVG